MIKFEIFQQIIITLENDEEIKKIKETLGMTVSEENKVIKKIKKTLSMAAVLSSLVVSKREVNDDQETIVYGLLLAEDETKNGIPNTTTNWLSNAKFKTKRFIDPKNYCFIIQNKNGQRLVISLGKSYILNEEDMQNSIKISEIENHHIKFSESKPYYQKWIEQYNPSKILKDIIEKGEKIALYVYEQYRGALPIEAYGENIRKLLNNIKAKIEKEATLIFPLKYLELNTQNFDDTKESLQQQIINKIIPVINEISENDSLNNNGLLSKYKVNVELDPNTIIMVNNTRLGALS